MSAESWKPPADESTTAALMALLLAVLLFIVEPFVARQVWAWFVVPLGLPPITWIQAAALPMLVRLWVKPIADISNKSTSQVLREVVTDWARCVVVLIIAALLHLAEAA